MKRWHLILDTDLPGSMNMSIDDVLMLRPCEAPPVLRLYSWDRTTLTIGMAQPLERHVNIEYCRREGIPVIRRITGGKAVLHSGELTYSFSGSTSDFPFSLKLLDCYREIGEAFCRACLELGINAVMAPRESRSAGGSVTSCFASPSAFEVVVNGRKLIGSAQKRTQQRVLQQGSLLIDYDPEDWRASMRRHSDNGTEHVTSFRMLMGDAFSKEQLIAAIVRAFERQFQTCFERHQISEVEQEMAERLAGSRYYDQAAPLDSNAVSLLQLQVWKNTLKRV